MRYLNYRCRVCDQPITMMCQGGTGYCSQHCKQLVGEDRDKPPPVATEARS